MDTYKQGEKMQDNTTKFRRYKECGNSKVVFVQSTFAPLEMTILFNPICVTHMFFLF